jgi:hypothetical protein
MWKDLKENQGENEKSGDIKEDRGYCEGKIVVI